MSNDYCGHPTANFDGQAMKCVHWIPCPRHSPTATGQPAAPKRERYTVWGVDRAGVPWDIESFDNPLHALRRYNVEWFINKPYQYTENGVLYAKQRDVTLGITDNKNEEAGDVYDRLVEDYCHDCWTPLDEEGLCAFRGFHEGETEEGK